LELDEKKNKHNKKKRKITKSCINEFVNKNQFEKNEKKGENNLLPPPTWSLLLPIFFQICSFKGPMPQALCTTTRRKRPICDHHIYNYLQLFGLCN
jgi:hypothetical protein